MECRLCKKPEASVAIWNPQKLLVDHIWTLCSIQVEKEDGLPNQICFQCEGKLESFANFRIVCTQTDLAFKQKINGNIELKEEILNFDETSNFSIQSFFDQSDESDDKTEQDLLIQLANDCSRKIKKENFTQEHQHTTDDSKHMIIDSKPTDDSTKPINSEPSNCVLFKGLLVGYINSNEMTKKYSCKDCDKFFTQKRSLQNHSQLHLNPNTFKCDACGRLFSRKHVFENHKIKCTGLNKPTHECVKCFKQFKNIYKLKEHTYTHSTKNLFPCNICGKYYKSKSVLQRHINRLHGERTKCQCNICGKMITPQAYWYHQKIHENYDKFECDLCGKAFKYKQAIVFHLKSHADIRPYKCEICSNKFKTLGVLKSHRLQHTGENPFKCDLCLKTFKQRCNLKSHMKHFHKHI